MHDRRWSWVLLACVLAPLGAPAEILSLSEDAGEVRRWNRFVEEVYALHEKRLAGREIRTEREIGGYRDYPAFYEEIRYYDRSSGRLLSKIQRERAHPERIHAIEVYLYDAQGRLARDYSAWYLPYARNAPLGAWITFYAYSPGLRALRQFDASDNRLYEACEGTFRGGSVNLRLWEDELIEVEEIPGSVFTTPAYRACFDALPESAGPFLHPH